MKKFEQYYLKLKIKRWFKNNIKGINSYHDKSIFIENVNSLNNYKVNRSLELVEELWIKNKDFSVWGAELFNIDKAYFDIYSEEYLSKEIDDLFILAGNFNAWSGHLSRICLMTYMLNYNNLLEPILIKENRSIIDGFHRLVAYKISNYNYIPCKLIRA